MGHLGFAACGFRTKTAGWRTHSTAEDPRAAFRRLLCDTLVYCLPWMSALGGNVTVWKSTLPRLAINPYGKLKMKNTFLFHRSHLSNKCLRDSQLNQYFQSPEIKLSSFREWDKNDWSRWNNLGLILALLTEWRYHQWFFPSCVIYFKNYLRLLNIYIYIYIYIYTRAHTHTHTHTHVSGLPGVTGGEEPSCQCRTCKSFRFNPWVRKIPWRRAWQLTPVFLPGESHGQRSLAGYGP